MDFSGKKALVTGAGQGIGRAIAEGLCKNGAKVFALDVNKGQLEELKKNNSEIEIIVCNLFGDEEDIKKALEPRLPFDLLVNNAGMTILEPFLEMSMKSFDRVLGLNLRATVIVSQIVAKTMVEHKIKGSIVHISSQASKFPLLDHTAYSVSKAGVDSLCRSMAMELGQYGIRVNCINPNVVMTAMGKMVWSDPVKAEPMLKRTPMGRFVEVSEVVNGVMFLLSDLASMTTGSCLPIDGGSCAM